MTTSSSFDHFHRIALAHDWLVNTRGGEQVLAQIAQIVEQEHALSGMYTMFCDEELLVAWQSQMGFAPITRARPRVVSRLNCLPTPMRRWLLPLYPHAVDQLSRRLARQHASEPIDLLISTSSAAIKGMRTPTATSGKSVPHICYCHTPPRYLWSQQDQYALGKGGRLRQAGLNMFGASLRAWDKKTAANVTQFIANSAHTQKQIQACYQRESIVVHPPVRTDFFTVDASVKRSDAWLCVGALEPYKRFDLAIKAAKLAGAHLLIAGTGSQQESLAELITTYPQKPDTRIEILGRVSDDRLRDLYRSSQVLIFPQIEDFGIIAVEAQACGLPVIAMNAGGAQETVVQGKTGEFFDETTHEAIVQAVERLLVQDRYTDQLCRKNALRFSVDSFEAKIREVIRDVLREHG